MLPLLLLLVPSPADEGQPPLFREVGTEVLPGVRTLCGSFEKDYIVETNGGGLVLGDFDGDGDPDLVVVDGSTLERVEAGEPGEPPRLYLNDGAGRFAPAGEQWAMAGGRWGMGGAAGDVDGDGDLDLLVTQWGPDRLFLNEAGEGFREVPAAEAGLFAHDVWGTSAAFLDYDGDGHLDLAVVHYLAFRPSEIASRRDGECTWKGHAVMCGPEGLIPIHDRLYRGKGDGTFRDVTREAGLRPEVAGFGLGVTTLDYDRDGDTDLYVTNDSTPNHLWENLGDGTFAEVGMRRNVGLDGNGKEQAGMGVAAGDVNGDGFPDLFVTNFSAENNALYLSQRRGQGPLVYRERSGPARIGGPSRVYLGWGTSLHDFDHDADLDFTVFNGHVYPQADERGTDTSYAQPDHLLRNDGSGRFSFEVLSDAVPGSSRASAAADLDGDGDLDLVALDLDGAVRVLRNEAAGGHWLRVRLRGATANTQALGALVTATFRPAPDAEPVQRTAEVRTAGGFQSAVPAEVHFGLARAGAVDLEVRWPSGRVSAHPALEPDRVVTLREPVPEGGEEEESADG